MTTLIWEGPLTMTIGKIIDRILKYHAEGLLTPYIKKPWAWAVFETWKWVDEHEKPREAVTNERDQL